MKVLFATDGSPWSHKAICKAASMLRAEGTEFHLVSVADLVPLIAAGEAPLGGAAAALERELIHAEHDADRAVALLQEMGVSATAYRRDGNPATEIVSLAREIKADLIVMGAHGKNALERLLLGSTSDSVLHQWQGATLIVRPLPGEA
jgi:nucleotide-binding universal stress UspA family protein